MAAALSPGRERLAFVSQVLQGYQVEVQVRVWKELCKTQTQRFLGKKIISHNDEVGSGSLSPSINLPFAGETPPLQSPPPPRDARSEGRGLGARRKVCQMFVW